MLSFRIGGVPDKRRKIESDSKLFLLLDRHPNIGEINEQLDCDAIIEELRQNPQLAATKYKFALHRRTIDEESRFIGYHICYPLHHAILLKANIDVIQTIYESYPPAIEEKCEYGTALHRAVGDNVQADVAAFLLSKHPAAAQKKDEEDDLPLHLACKYGASVDLVSSILNTWPDAAMQKNRAGDIPLHLAARYAPAEIVRVISEHCPEAIKEKGRYGFTPLHCACANSEMALEMAVLLLEKWPEAIMEKDNNEEMPGDIYMDCSETESDPGDDENSQNIQKLLSYVHRLCSEPMDNVVSKEMMDFFIEIKWWRGVLLILDRYPSVKKQIDMETNVFPDFLSVIGRCCKLKTMWVVIGNELDIIESV